MSLALRKPAVLVVAAAWMWVLVAAPTSVAVRITVPVAALTEVTTLAWAPLSTPSSLALSLALRKPAALVVAAVWVWLLRENPLA